MPSSLLSRRRFLAGTAILAAPAIIRPAQAGFSIAAPRSVAVYNTHSGESLKTVYWADGHYIKGAIKQLDWVLRDHYSNEVKPIDVGLLDLMSMVQERCETRDPLLIICGYRSAATNAMKLARGDGVAQHSLHIQAKAVDVRLERRTLPQLRDAVSSLGRGGVGYYPQDAFIHMDTGPVRHW